MGSLLQTDEDNIKLSNSPRRSPQIADGLSSPVRSVHPRMQQMDSIHSQPDFGLRTADFFDDSSGDEADAARDPGEIAPDVELLEQRGTATKKRHSNHLAEPLASQCESKGDVLPDKEGYQRLMPTGHDEQSPDTPSSSFNGSVSELLPGGTSSPPQFSHKDRVPCGKTPRNSSHIEPSADRTSKIDSSLEAYAIAHEITLQALMRDENAIDRSLQSLPFAPLQPSNRHSLLRGSLRMHDDPRSPRYPHHSTPPSTGKRVNVVPPPIDTSAPRRSLPEDMIRTPYPHTPDRVYRKDIGRSPPSATASTSIPPAESVLTLSIRRSNPDSKPRVTSLTIPTSNDFSAVRTSGLKAKEQHFDAIEFDDSELFRSMRKRYTELSGLMRFLSARSLTRITVSGSASKEADAKYGWLSQPRSPRRLAYKGLSDTFSEEKVLQHFRNPALGRSRYAFVHWAHRLAAAPPVRTPQVDQGEGEQIDRELIRRGEQPEGLEFVVSWSITRILLVLGTVILLSIAAALLWTLLGKNTVDGWPPQDGFRDAGDRIVPGVVMGICILLVGLTTMAGWLGVSWLVM